MVCFVCMQTKLQEWSQCTKCMYFFTIQDHSVPWMLNAHYHRRKDHRITTVSERGGGHQLNETHEFIAILGNPKICSAMALAMSIYRTLCVLVYTANHVLVMDSLRSIQYPPPFVDQIRKVVFDVPLRIALKV